MSNYIFEMNNLSYKTTHGELDDINLTIHFGEIHALIIKNSSEQNLFIRLLEEIHQIADYQGILKYKGQPLTNRNKDKIAILQEQPLLINNFSVAENLNFTAIPTRKYLPFISWRKVKSKAKDLLKQLNLDIDPHIKVKNLSDEERRAVYFAKVFMEKPDLIIMQEPMEGLSSLYSANLYKILKQYRENGGSIIYITKQWEDAMKLADRISIFSQGKIIDEMLADLAKKDPRRLLSKLDGYAFKEDRKYKDDETQSVLEAIFNAAEFLASEYELKDVLLLLAREVAKVMDADGCSIKLIDELTGSTIDDFEIKNNENINCQLTEDAIERITKENNIYYANANNKTFFALFKKVENVKTFIGVPVLIRNQVTGIIQIYYKSLYVHSHEETKYLSTLARHAAIAIEDTRLMGRSAFLQESHHRIKNNLQSIVGLISLQKIFVKNNPNSSIDDTLDSIISKVKSIASVHDLLSKEKLGRSIINVKEIIVAVIDIVNNDPRITLQFDLEDILIPYNKATSIALIINELVINCFKHAFVSMESGKIHIQCKRIDEIILLSVSDNGRGFPKNFDFRKGDSLGLSIIQGIVTNDFNGAIEFKDTKRNTIEISLPSSKIFITAVD